MLDLGLLLPPAAVLMRMKMKMKTEKEEEEMVQ
jgi:hypothetical protein